MKKFLSLALALVMTMSLVTISAGAKDFTDNSKITYSDAVNVMSTIKVVDGYAEGDFRPANTLTRGAAAKIICNMILGPTTAGALPTSVAPFKDVPAGSTFAGYIAYCSQQNIINGYGDGTFRPSGTLNGYAFMKMLLGALGYDGSIEGFTGANWSVNVAKLAIGIGLADGLVEDFNGSKAVTREEACLYAFNTLQADMVKYADAGSSITVGGVEIVTKPSTAEVVTSTAKSDTINAEKDGNYVVQFGERYFKDLEKKDGKYDKFGRPAVQWTYDGDEICVVADEATVSYTKSVKQKDLYKDADLKSGNEFYVWTDGEEADETVKIAKDSSTEIGGKGILVEVFYDDSEDARESDQRIVIINTYVSEVSDVDTNDDDERIVTVDGLDYVTEEFEEDDVVMYTKDADAEKDERIQTMVALEKLTGELTRKSGDKYTIDGTVYELSASEGAELSEVAVKDTVDFYLDSYGYIVKIEVAEESDNVENLAMILDAGTDRATDWAKLLFSDGKTKVVDTTKTFTNADKGMIVSFKVEDDGTYKLTKKTNANAKAATSSFEKGETRIKGESGATICKVDSKTVFVYAVKDSDGTDYNVYTGYKSAPSFNGSAVVNAYTGKDKSAASIVFVEVGKSDMHSTSADLTFLAVEDDMKTIDDGDDVVYYEFQAVVGGKIETVKIAANEFSEDGLKLIDGVIVLNKVSYDSDDLGDAGTSYTTSTNPYGDEKDVYTATVSKKESNGVLTFGTSDKTYTLSYTDDLKVFFVDGDEITEGSVSDIREDNGEGKDIAKDPYGTIYYTLDDGDVDMVVIVKK